MAALVTSSMIVLPQSINHRKVFYLNIQNDLSELSGLHLENWALFLIEDDPDNAILWLLADICIEKNLLYMSAFGKAGSEVEDVFDMAMVMRNEEGKSLPSWYLSEDDVLMTTWHRDFNEGFWFITHAANYENYTIDKVVIINLTKDDYLPKIQKLTIKFNSRK